ncbi:hypothetical protein RA307_19530 [Xanthobacteraceae bacterium Astr-EGSB]|uniref:hypothetical protein n=1 Tax=Astrobacterium formosum TaxID=3069710 RepID=UPI0027B3FE45|nr:hypothetical protein [Xanthobacteraceae bacterium Astr-EGSB]
MTDRFVVDQNIEKFRKLLASDMDDCRRSTLTKLLAEEECKLPAEPHSEVGVSRLPLRR